MEVTVQARLRAASHPYHVRINHHPLLVGLTGRGFLLSNYLTILSAYFHLYEQLESSIRQFSDTHVISFDYSSKLKMPWLKQDLEHFKEDPLSGLNRPPTPIEFPKIESVGQLIGVLYPIEGSTLGGQVISGHLNKSHALSTNEGARFFSGYGDNTVAYWQEFCRFADSIKGNEEQIQAAQEATLLTFKKFEDTLNEYHRIRN